MYAAPAPSPDSGAVWWAVPGRVRVRVRRERSGPAQLALAILADALGPERAVELYQAFKRDFVAKADGDEFRVTLEAVREWVAKQAQPPSADALDVWGESLGE